MIYIGEIAILAWVLIGLFIGIFIGAMLMYHHIVTYGDDETNDQIQHLRTARLELEKARFANSLYKLAHNGRSAKIDIIVNKHEEE
jgi:hypothetical protein